MKAHFSGLYQYFKSNSDEFSVAWTTDTSFSVAPASPVLGDSRPVPKQKSQVEEEKEKAAVGAAVKALVKEVSTNSRVFLTMRKTLF